jgi:Phage integrase, N-terminal SAM-like domain
VEAVPNLERATLNSYASHWNRHALPALGHLELRKITPQVIAEFRAELQSAGVVPRRCDVRSVSAERQIKEARRRVNGPQKNPTKRPVDTPSSRKGLQSTEADARIRTGDPFITRMKSSR